jgi:hypothetical protein
MKKEMNGVVTIVAVAGERLVTLAVDFAAPKSWNALAQSYKTLYGFKQGILKKYYCTVDLLFDWFGLVCFANKNKNCQLIPTQSNRRSTVE